MSSPKEQPPCPICRKGLKKITSQCASGHKVCNSCLTTPSIVCPICRAWINRIVLPPIRCRYTKRGCKYILEPEDVDLHHQMCRFRDFECEGHRFGCWDCPWIGRYDQISDHFEEEHQDSTGMLFKTEAALKLDLNEDFRSISLIDFHEGQNFFWFKCKVDKKRRMFFSTVQLIGTSNMAQKYCYEFEIFRGPVRKIKVTEICDSEAIDAERIFENENCVAISFETLKNYLDENGMTTKMYVSMNWTCVVCDNMFMSPLFASCSQNHLICEECYEIVIPTEGCPKCRALNGERLENDEEGAQPAPGAYAVEGPRECAFKEKGCNYFPTEPWRLWRHSEGCKWRVYSCEGSVLGLWKCGWNGAYYELEEHFLVNHPSNLDLLRSKTNVVMRLDLKKDQGALQILKFNEELFYYKHKLDPKLGRLFVIVQMVGPEEEANKYLYHYVIKRNCRTFSVQEVCQSDGTPTSYFWGVERCIVLSLKNLKTFMIDDKLVFDIIVMNR